MSDGYDPNVFWVKVRALDPEVPAAVAIRRWLKQGLRSFRVKALSIEAVDVPGEAPPVPQGGPGPPPLPDVVTPAPRRPRRCF